MAKTAIEPAISFSALKFAFRVDEASCWLARCVSLRSRGNDEPVRQYGHDADVVGDIGRCAGTDPDCDRENPNQSRKQREHLSRQADLRVERGIIHVNAKPITSTTAITLSAILAFSCS